MAHSGSYEIRRDTPLEEHDRLERQAAALWSSEAALLRDRGLGPGLKVLEVGCGPGRFLNRVTSEFRVAAIGLDIDRESLRALPPRIYGVAGSAHELPFGGDTFDFALVRFVLRHIRRPEKVVAEVMRVLKPGGGICVLEPDEGTLTLEPVPPRWPRLFAALTRTARLRGGDPTVGRRVREFLLRSGAKDVRSDLVPITSDQSSASTFVRTFLAPSARPVDRSILTPTEADEAWSEVLQWSKSPEALAYAVLVFSSGKKPGD
jgi:ubiquinone/menaquinone biosynthesis C-methylase UbiE